MTTEIDDDTGPRKVLQQLGDRLIKKGRATVKFGQALRRKDAKWSTIVKLAGEAECTINIGVNGETITGNIGAKKPAPRRHYDHDLLACLQDLLEAGGEKVTIAYLDDLTAAELHELSAYARDLGNWKHLDGEDPDCKPARPNFLPEHEPTTDELGIDTDPVGAAPEPSVEDDIPA